MFNFGDNVDRDKLSTATLYIHLYSPMNGRKNAKQYKNNAVTLTILKYSATVIEHI